MIDLRTKAWLDDMFIYGGGNVYGPPQLKEATDTRGEWAERFRANFDHIIAERTLTALDYENRTEVSFDSDEEFYSYLLSLHRFLYADGPMP